MTASNGNKNSDWLYLRQRVSHPITVFMFTNKSNITKNRLEVGSKLKSIAVHWLEILSCFSDFFLQC